MASPSSPFAVKHPSFRDIVGTDPSISVCAESSDGTPLFHEACVFLPATSSLYVTSNIIEKAGKKNIFVSRIDLSSPPTYEVETVDAGLIMGNGGVNYKDGILFCDQGDLYHDSCLTYVRPSSDGTYSTQILISDFDGVPFNSLNDVVVAEDGGIWFTDPPYGSEQGFRGPPQLPAMVYRFEPSSGSVKAMADGFGRPNGLAFSPDESVLYVTVSWYISFQLLHRVIDEEFHRTPITSTAMARKILHALPRCK